MKYLFQWMILITMSLSLAACGGSSGSKGDKGDDGTIALPTMGSEALSFIQKDQYQETVTLT